MKIRRNALCPCGSGLKYKKCCIDKAVAAPQVQAKAEPAVEVYPFLSISDTHELIKTFSGLSVLPENHGKYFRLELLITHTLLQSHDNGTIPQPDNLKKFVDHHFESHYMEDICVNTFTDLITFFGGDYLTFPGITENGQEIVTNLLSAIFHRPYSVISSLFQSNVMHASYLVLAISDKIAKQLNYTRYQEGEATEHALFLPDQARLDLLKQAVTFTNEEMAALLAKYEIPPEALDRFLLDPATITGDTLRTVRNPILYTPILKTDTDYIVMSPSSLCLALSDFIWTMAAESGYMPQLNKAYHDVVWNNLQLQLQQLKFKFVEVEGFELTENLKDGLYKFDDDKIAYIYYLGDDGQNYNTDRSVFGCASSSAATDRSSAAIATVKAHPVYKDFQVLSLTFLSCIGRDLTHVLMKNDADRFLTMLVYELEILWRLKDTDAIDLWKYTIARDELYEKIHGFYSPVISFLDQFKLYRDKSDSFYLSDDSPVVIPGIEPGYALDWFLQAKRWADKHSEKEKRTNSVAIVPVEKKESYAPVYLNLMNLANTHLSFMIDGFHQPIWVKPVSMPDKMSGNLKDMYWQLTDTIAYWLWQIQNAIKDPLLPMGNAPIDVTFDLSSLKKFDQIERDFVRKENLASFFTVTGRNDGFNITIPGEIIPYLYGPDNEGERVLVRQLILGFREMLVLNGLPLIADETIDHIIEMDAPLGMKKKFFILDTNDNLLLDPRNLKGCRYVQDYDVSKVLDEIVPRLGVACPPVGDIKTKEERNDLAKKIANDILLNLLREKLNKLDSTDLMKRLIGLNESLIRKREKLRVLTPTRIACFVSVEQQQADLKESLDKVNRTTIAIRCLIEHIAAEPSAGSGPVSKTAIDELLGIMDQTIAWGSTSDHIHFDLFDIKMAILPSGRVGTEKTIFDEVFDPYYQSKSSESVKDAVSTFNQVFPQTAPSRGKDIPEKLDDAFKADYGVSLNRIFEFIGSLAQIGFLQANDYASLPLSQLRAEANKYSKSIFDEQEFQYVMAYLALEKRGLITNIDKAKGYEYIDIMPWRFNRMLSLMRKPLVITGDVKDGDRVAYWGPRQVLASRIYLAEQCLSDRLRVLKNSVAIKKALGDFAQTRGDELVKVIVASIDPTGLIIDQEKFIGPKCEFKHTEDIGDIDVLIIDNTKKTIYSLESKSMSPSRNIKEMVEEMSKLFGSSSEKGWIQKHLNRHDWIERNMGQLEKKYGVSLAGFQVKSFFVTEEDMLAPYLRKMELNLPFITKYDLEKKGIGALK